MRGWDERSGSLFSYVDLEARVGKDHPIRIIRGVVNEALAALSGEFSALYSRSGRPSIPPEKLLPAMLLQAFYSIRGAAVDGAAGVRPLVALVRRRRG
jgi:transposase